MRYDEECKKQCSILKDGCAYPDKRCWDCKLNYAVEEAKWRLKKMKESPTVENASKVDIDAMKDEIEQNAMRYSLAKENHGMGHVEWNDYLISRDKVLEIIDKYFV